MCKGSFGGCQGQPSARPWHLLIDPSGLQPFPPHRFVSLSSLRLLPTSLPYRPLPSTLRWLMLGLPAPYRTPGQVCLTICLNDALYRRAASRILGVFMRDNLRSASCTHISIISDSVGMVVVIELYKETDEARSRAHVPLSPVFRWAA